MCKIKGGPKKILSLYLDESGTIVLHAQGSIFYIKHFNSLEGGFSEEGLSFSR